MACGFVAPDPPVFYNTVSRAEKMVIHRNHFFLYAGRTGQDLKSRSRLIGIRHTRISPHLVTQILLFFCCHRSRVPCNFKRRIQVKFRCAGHGVDFPIIGIHHNDINTFCLLFLKDLIRHLVCVLHDGHIQTGGKILAGYRFHSLLRSVFYLHAACRSSRKDCSINSFQKFFVTYL